MTSDDESQFVSFVYRTMVLNGLFVFFGISFLSTVLKVSRPKILSSSFWMASFISAELYIGSPSVSLP